MSVTLDLLRHGETELGGSFRGSLDDLLTPLGWEQMQAATEIAGEWDAIISSPLRRCADFAFELSRQQCLPLILLDGIRELHFGEWEGRHASELMEDQAEALGQFWADPYGFTPPAGEPVSDFETRVLQALDELLERRPGQRLLLITHGGVMRLLLARARRLAREALLQVEVANGQLFHLEYDQAGSLRECPC